MNRRTIFVIFVTFLSVGCRSNYSVVDGKVLWNDWNEATGFFEVEVKGADHRTFTALERGDYGKDKKHVYFQERQVKDANPSSFVTLKSNYAKDTKSVFYAGNRIEDADPESIELLKQHPYARDKNDIYHQIWKINACDAKSFHFLDSTWQSDATCVYHRGQKLPGADPKTFVILSSFLAKDNYSVFYTNIKLEEADPATFELMLPCKVCGKDKLNCYRFREKVPCR